ncbi:unnamed protein product [Effrenium voratum]|nr:unnamed protein product [Effrenium voratum]CAJ1401017.1 unnamed protein product [Effrenium voratum]
MPTKPPAWLRLKYAVQIVYLPCLVGSVLGGLWQLFPDETSDREQHVDLTMFLVVVLTGLGFAMLGLAMCLCSKDCRHRLRSRLRLLHSLLVLTIALVTIPWFCLPPMGSSSWDHFLHYFIPFALLIMNACRALQLNECVLENLELSQHANYLRFQTLDDASCSNPVDEERIRQSILGHEADVDTAIRVLMKAGAYTEDLRLAHEAGYDITGKGNTDIIAKMEMAALLWFVSAIDTFAAIDACDRGPWMPALFFAAAISVLTTIGLPLLVWYLMRRGQHKAVFAVNVCTTSAALGLGIPLLLQISNHLLHAMCFLERPRMNRPCPSLFSMLMLAVLRPCLAFGALICAFCGPEPVERLQSHVRTMSNLGSFTGRMGTGGLSCTSFTSTSCSSLASDSSDEEGHDEEGRSEPSGSDRDLRSQKSDFYGSVQEESL